MNAWNRIVLFLASVFSGISLLLSLLYTLTYFDINLTIGPSKGTTLVSLGLSVVAFVTTLKVKSHLVGVLLTISGLIIIIPPVSAIIADGTITYPGPILGVVFFSPILALGIAKLVTSRSRASESSRLVVTSQELNGSG
jgi:hypothetical protein